MDGMTIDEVIKYFDDDAKENAKLAIIYRGNDDDLAEMHKQDANRSAYVSVWLRELKAYRKAKKKIIENMKSWEKIFNEPLEWNDEDINSIKLAFYQDGKADAYTDCIGICEIAFEEVNADADSD